MTLAERIQNSFVAGLILVTPLVVTAYVLKLLVGWSLQVVDPVVTATGLLGYTGNVEAAAQATAAVLIVGVVTGLGALAQRRAGRLTFGSVGRVVNLVPLVNTIYGSVRQVANSLAAQNTRYESVVVVEYPREGVYTLGLVTGEAPAAVANVAGEPAYSVYLPNSPNPTGGRLLLVPESQVHETDMSVRRGLRTLVTTGTTGDGDGVTNDGTTRREPTRPKVRP